MLDKIGFVCLLISAIMFIAFGIAGYLRAMSYEDATFWMVICFFNFYLNQEK